MKIKRKFKMKNPKNGTNEILLIVLLDDAFLFARVIQMNIRERKGVDSFFSLCIYKIHKHTHTHVFITRI